MSMKPNPGCTIPDLPEVPDVKSFLETTLPANAIASVIPTSEILKLVEIAETIKEEVEAYTSAIERRARTLKKLLEIPCPLPPVLDGGFDTDVVGVHSLLDVEGGEFTKGESLLIEEGDGF